MYVFYRFEEEGIGIELFWNKVLIIFNFVRLLEELYKIFSVILFYCLILFKVSSNLENYIFFLYFVNLFWI